jgi:Tfp pilus assembly protein PilX
MILFARKMADSSEQGMALAMALLTLLLISTIVSAMLVMSTSETRISFNFRDEQVAHYAAKAGLEEVRDRMRSNAPNSLSANLPNLLPGTNQGVLYITNPKNGETVTPWTGSGNNQTGNNNGNYGNGCSGTTCGDAQVCLELSCTGGAPAGSPWYASSTAGATYAFAPKLDWKWVRLMLKTNKPFASSIIVSVDGTTQFNGVCWNGRNEVLVTPPTTCAQANPSYKPVYELTAFALTSSGSRRAEQYEVTSSAFPVPPAAMLFDGPNPTYNAPNSNAFQVNGNDANLGPNGGVGCGAASNQPAVGAFNSAAVNPLTTAIPRPDKYTGVSGSGSPSVQDVSGALGPLSTVDGLTNLVNQVTASADPTNIYAGNATSLTNPGTNSTPVINVVQGDLTLGGGFTGSGILLVTGTLTMSGNPNFNGLILVIGKGVFNKNGGGNGTLNGSLVVANLFDSSTFPKPIPLGANNPPGSPTINWNGGGNATIQYDSCWINTMSSTFPYRVIADRDLLNF